MILREFTFKTKTILRRDHPPPQCEINPIRD